MAFQIYKSGVGVYARSAVAGIFGVASIFAAYSLYGALLDLPALYAGTKIPILGINLTWGFVGSAVLLLLLAFVLCIFTMGFEVGLTLIDGKSKKAIEFFIEIQAELQKVAWPTRAELVGSTVVVIIFLVLLAAYIFGVDWIVSSVMETIGVL